MTNAEKFKEDFGFEPNKDSCLDGGRGIKCKHCEHWYKGINVSECQAYKFWQSEYQGEPTIPLSVIEKIHDAIDDMDYEDLTFYDGVNKLGNAEYVCREEVHEIIDKAVKEIEKDANM